MSPTHISPMLRSILVPASDVEQYPRDSVETLVPMLFGRRKHKKHRQKPCEGEDCPESTKGPVKKAPAFYHLGRPLSPLLPDQPLPNDAGPYAAAGTPSGGTARIPVAANSFTTVPGTNPTQTSASNEATSSLGQSFSQPTQPSTSSGPPFSSPTQSASGQPSSSLSSSSSTTTSLSSLLPPGAPTPSIKPNPPQTQLATNHPRVAAIVGGLFGGLIFISIVILIAFFFVRRRRRRVAPSAEFMRGAPRPSFLRIASEDNLGRDVPPNNVRGGYDEPTYMTNTMMQKEVV